MIDLRNYMRKRKPDEGALTFKFCKCFNACKFVSLDDFARVEAHNKKILRFLEQFSCEDDDHVGRVTHLDLS